MPSGLAKRRVISVDLAALLAGTQYRGSFEERMHGIVDEAQDSHPEIILFIDEIHTIVGAGQVCSLFIANFRDNLKRYTSCASACLHARARHQTTQMRHPDEPSAQSKLQRCVVHRWKALWTQQTSSSLRWRAARCTASAPPRLASINATLPPMARWLGASSLSLSKSHRLRRLARYYMVCRCCDCAHDCVLFEHSRMSGVVISSVVLVSNYIVVAIAASRCICLQAGPRSAGSDSGTWCFVSATTSLMLVQGRYELFHKVRFRSAALDAAVACATAYSSDRKLPDSAIDLMDEAAALRRMHVPSTPAAFGTTAPAKQHDLQQTELPDANAQAWQQLGADREPRFDRAVSESQRLAHEARHIPGATATAFAAPLSDRSLHSCSNGTGIPHPFERSDVSAASQSARPNGPYRMPKICPHCGYAVTDAASATLLCPDCLTLFLNISQDKLMLGTSAVPMHVRMGVQAPPQRGLSQAAQADAQAGLLQPQGAHILREGIADEPVGDAGGDQPFSEQAAGCSHDESAPGGTPLDSSLSQQQDAHTDDEHVWVEREHVLEIVSAQSGVPPGLLAADAAWFGGLRTQLSSRVVGQDDTITCEHLLILPAMLVCCFVHRVGSVNLLYPVAQSDNASLAC